MNENANILRGVAELIASKGSTLERLLNEQAELMELIAERDGALTRTLSRINWQLNTEQSILNGLRDELISIALVGIDNEREGERLAERVREQRNLVHLLTEERNALRAVIGGF